MRTTFSVEYTIDDLRRMIERPLMYKPVNFYKGIPIHLVENAENLPGEKFIKGEVKPYGIFEASNLGRIKKDGKMLKQYSKNQHDYDYLSVDENCLVHRIVAALWCKIPDGFEIENLEVHHVNNNGYDNRPCNLLWVTKEEHREIEKDIFNPAKLDFETYKYV